VPARFAPAIARAARRWSSEAASHLARVRLVRYPHAPLRERVWELRDDLSAYDATYLALAEALDDPVLVTSDRGLAAGAQASLGDHRVRLIGWPERGRRRGGFR
jgi:predicted nucleic acid-binding protein